MYTKLKFDKKTGRYVVNSTDLAYEVNRTVSDIEYKIEQLRGKLESVGVLSFNTSLYGTKRLNLNAVQLYLFLQDHAAMKNDITDLIQSTMVAANMDDRDLACSLKDRKHTLGIK